MVCPSVAHGRLDRGAAAEGHVSSARSMALAALSYSASTSVKEKSINTLHTLYTRVREHGLLFSFRLVS